ncbi:MAG: hypothetical protein RLZZ387_5642 [Chloroflexota bacterium]
MPALTGRDELRELAGAVRRACLRAAIEAYEQAGADGLCAEGAWEAALGAISALDLEEVVGASSAGGDERPST